MKVACGNIKAAAPEYFILPLGSNLQDSEQPLGQGELHVAATSDTLRFQPLGPSFWQQQ